MNVMLTGTSGFLGRHLFDQLNLRGHKVFKGVRDPQGTSGIEGIWIGDTVDNLVNSFLKNKIQVVINVGAADSSLASELNNFEDLIMGNFVTPTNMLISSSRAGVDKFIQIGTNWEFLNGDRDDCFNLYAASKKSFNVISRYISKTYNIDYINFILFDTYGPNDKRPKILNKMLDTLKSDLFLDMSPGMQKIHLVHIYDVCGAIIMGLEERNRESAFRNFVIDSEKPLSLIEITKILNSLGLSPKINFGKIPYRKNEIMMPPKLFSRFPGWSPKINFEEGVLDLIEK
jgi:nucleoside-diphosphate-sugar epimerase